jgi:hypothetical protein
MNQLNIFLKKNVQLFAHMVPDCYICISSILNH